MGSTKEVSKGIDAVDPALGSDEDPAWFVTSAIRHVLNICGFAEDQLDIPHIPLRFFFKPGEKPDGLLILQPGQPAGDWIRKVAMSYLNRWVTWCPQAGLRGKWRLIAPPTGEETPLWNFVLTPPAAGPKLVLRAASYGTKTSPIVGPHERFPLESWIVSGEGNVLTVSGGWDRKTGERFQMSFINPDSFDAPSHPNQADENSLDFISAGVIPIEYVDIDLQSIEAVSFIGRRIFELACRSEKWARFVAEAVLVDGSETEPAIYQAPPDGRGTRRLLRVGDMVTVAGALHMVRSVSPAWTNSGCMLAHYETQLFRGEATWS